MAFQKALPDFPSAYHKINMMVADKDNGVRILVCAYESQAARLAGAAEVSTVQHNFDWNPDITAANPVAYSYLLLATLPYFADAEVV